MRTRNWTVLAALAVLVAAAALGGVACVAYLVLVAP